jgi:cobalt-zinc-cadmium resistance protein CzcA
VATITPGVAPPVGMGSADGEGEALFAVVQLLAGADALRTVQALRARLDEIRPSLPEDVVVEVIYDREALVGNTLRTVARSLAEGGLLVVIVLMLLLGDLRAGLVVASVIPLSLLGAFTGLWLTGGSGNLMSLGAIDFGLVVDGTIVLVEGIVGMDAVVGATAAARAEAVRGAAQRVSRPVLFAVLILIIVYLPILGMVGTEGKLFRPMALTVLFALITALVLTFTYVPAISSLVVHPKGHHTTPLLRLLSRPYLPALAKMLTRPRAAVLGAAGLVGLGALGASQLGLEFVPRLEEGDLVVQTARLPSISAAEALAETTRVERALRRFPEVLRVASRTGSPALATDPMGLEETDVLVRLRPKDQWTTAPDMAGLVAAMEAAIHAEAPGAALTFTQPIEMRFNELLEGVPSDVGVQIYGEDLVALEAAGRAVAAVLEGVPGAADVKAPAAEGTPGLDLHLDPGALARLGVDAAVPRALVSALQRGVPVGALLRGTVREEVVLTLARPPGGALIDLPFVAGRDAEGPVVHTLGDVARAEELERPALVRRQGGSRRVSVLANVRGRDLGAFVAEATPLVAQVKLPPGAYISWSGKMEQLRAAALRTALTVPAALAVIFALLRVALGSTKAAALISLNVPAAASGGVFALLLTGQPLSMSAVVGFIALFGVAVMNGVVLVSRTRELHAAPEGRAAGAAAASAQERFRPVLMTALVAGIGFLPDGPGHRGRRRGAAPPRHGGAGRPAHRHAADPAAAARALRPPLRRRGRLRRRAGGPAGQAGGRVRPGVRCAPSAGGRPAPAGRARPLCPLPRARRRVGGAAAATRSTRREQRAAGHQARAGAPAAASSHATQMVAPCPPPARAEAARGAADPSNRWPVRPRAASAGSRRTSFDARATGGPG